jgi:hypothetical protein
MAVLCHGSNSFLDRLKPVISPTKLELLKAIKTCDIINPSFQGIAGDICY